MSKNTPYDEEKLAQIIQRELESNRAFTKQERNILKRSLLIVDWLMLLCGFLVAYYIRFQTNWQIFNQKVVPDEQFYGLFMFILLLVFTLLFQIFGLYDLKNLFSGTKEYSQILHASTFGAMFIILLSFFFNEITVARGWLVLSWVFIVGFMEIGRFSLRRLVQSMRKRGYFSTRVIIVGANEEGRAIASQLIEDSKTGVRVVGFVDDRFPPGTEIFPDTFVLGSLDAVEILIDQGDIQQVLVPATALPREKLLRLFQDLTTHDGVEILMSSGLYELITTGVEVQKVGNVPLLSINKVRLTGVDTWLKRGLDVGVSLSILPFLLMIAIPVAIFIRIESSGPIFHRRRVMGVGGKQFDAFKFRTMYVDGDKRLTPELKQELEQQGKLKDDPRITKLGKFLRPTSLDELPQIINVLRGQMSLVGPRMITYEEQSKYGRWRTNLVTVKPGITGLWQVSGRSDLSYEDRVMLDMQYIRNYSIWFDLHLLWRTIPAVLAKRGAY